MLSMEEIRGIMVMTLRGLHEIHQLGLVHRDMKPGNLLIKNYNGQFCLKLADFGQTRPINYSKEVPLSLEVGTKWYKAPEILLGSRDYTNKVDMWSIGCILAELLDHTPLFMGSTDFDQLSKIAGFLG